MKTKKLPTELKESKFMNEGVLMIIEEVFGEIADGAVYGHVCSVMKYEDDEIRAEMKLIVPHANMDEEVWDDIYAAIEECLERNGIEEEVDNLFDMDNVECGVRLPNDIIFEYDEISIRLKIEEVEKILTQTTE